MNIKSVVSAIAYIALAGVLLATAIALNNRQVPSVKDERPATGAGGLNAELARCNAIGPEAANDAICKAVWEANRRRFLESGKPHADKSIAPLPPASDWRPSSSQAEASKSTPQSPATLNRSRAPGGSPGARAE